MKQFLRRLGDGVDRTFGSVRSSVDITPWNKDGGSAFGLKRNEARWVAWVLLFFGLMLADPPGGLLPNDFLNIGLSGVLAKYLGFFSMEVWLLLSYTFVAWFLILLGAFVYPANTGSMLGSLFDKVKNAVKRVLKNPVWLVITLVGFYYAFVFFKGRFGL